MAKFIMKPVSLLAILGFLTVNNAINRPVYKVLLSQKGYTQFLQYDVEIPPMREFTFCTWIRFFEMNFADQSIFSYVVDGNTRIMRFWLAKYGNVVKVAVNDKLVADIPVNLTENMWHHVCFSYQADYGAWALYLDGRIGHCESSGVIKGYVLPGGGSVVVGYGLNEHGIAIGLEGEIFGVNMILKSTILRNYTIELIPRYRQKLFRRNKIKNGFEDMDYIIFNNLKRDDFNYGRLQTLKPQISSTKLKRFRKAPTTTTENMQRLFFGFDDQKKPTSIDEAKIHIWNIINKAGQQGKFKQENNAPEIFGSGTQELPSLSVFETPPSSDPSSFNLYDSIFETEKPSAKPQPFSHSSDKLQEKPKILDVAFNPKPKPMDTMPLYPQSNDLVDIETPPPPQKKTEVYGQWTGSSQFSNNVLEYLKNINFQYKKLSKPPPVSLVPPTIPLVQTSDSFPYASSTYVSKVHHSKPRRFQRRSFVDKEFISQVKRETTSNKNINVQILEDDLRSSILKLHADTRPKYVEVTNRGHAKGSYRRYRNVDDQEESAEENKNNDMSIIPFVEDPNISNHKMTLEHDAYDDKNLVSTLPFIKSLEYFVDNKNNHNHQPTKTNEWHNIKMYNLDQPRPITLESVDVFNSKARIGQKARINERSPISVIYNDQRGRLESVLTDGNLIADREMAKNVANKADLDQPVSIFKYNRGYLPGHKDKQIKKERGPKRTHSKNTTTSNFNKSVKIGNALNELPVIGFSNQEKKKSFVGGDARIPDINRYRSDIDSDNSSQSSVPPSLPAAVCRSIDQVAGDTILYVQQDGSVDAVNWQSPLREMGVAIKFIQINYKKCSYEESNLENNILLLINWNKTPVRLFGGAYPLRTKDLCGFF